MLNVIKINKDNKKKCMGHKYNITLISNNVGRKTELKK